MNYEIKQLIYKILKHKWTGLENGHAVDGMVETWAREMELIKIEQVKVLKTKALIFATLLAVVTGYFTGASVIEVLILQYVAFSAFVIAGGRR